MRRAVLRSRAGLGPLGVSLLAGALLLAGCLPPSPNDAQGDVHDLRVLAMRLDPPEVVVPDAPGAPPVPVKITALVASPKRGLVSVRLRGCELYDPTGCTTTAPDSTGFTTQGVGQVGIPPSPAAPSASYVTTRSLPADFLQGLMADDDLKGLLGVRPVFEVRAQAVTQEIAYKRLAVSWSDTVYRLILAQAGIKVCDATGQPAGCVPWKTKTPNRNPVFEKLQVRFDERQGQDKTFVDLPTDGPLVLKPAEQVTFHPVSGAGSAETYQTLTVDLQTRKVHIESRTELLEYAWFSTAGIFQLDNTEKKRTLGVDDAYEAPAVAPGSDTRDVYLWVVLRDTRGGVDFKTVHVLVKR